VRPCVNCGFLQKKSVHNMKLCTDCNRTHEKEKQRAISAVTKAVRNGDLPKASVCKCVDCGRQAQQHDHRDYTKPLEVEPVCRSCNQKRGHAFNSIFRAVNFPWPGAPTPPRALLDLSPP
jgi:hypothetical protein